MSPVMSLSCPLLCPRHVPGHVPCHVPCHFPCYVPCRFSAVLPATSCGTFSSASPSHDPSRVRVTTPLSESRPFASPSHDPSRVRVTTPLRVSSRVRVTTPSLVRVTPPHYSSPIRNCRTCPPVSRPRAGDRGHDKEQPSRPLWRGINKEHQSCPLSRGQDKGRPSCPLWRGINKEHQSCPLSRGHDKSTSLIPYRGDKTRGARLIPCYPLV